MLILVAAAWGFPQASPASVIDFTDNPDAGLNAADLSSFSEIFDGVTASFTSPTNDLSPQTFVFVVDTFRMGSSFLTRSFEVVFDATVDFVGYSSTGSSLLFDITGNGVNSIGNPNSSSTFGTPITFLAGDTYTFTATPPSPPFGFIGFSEWRFSTTVQAPAPTTVALLALGLAAVRFGGRRKLQF
jgi:hypothetical protein